MSVICKDIWIKHRWWHNLILTSNRICNHQPLPFNCTSLTSWNNAPCPFCSLAPGCHTVRALTWYFIGPCKMEARASTAAWDSVFRCIREDAVRQLLPPLTHSKKESCHKILEHHPLLTLGVSSWRQHSDGTSNPHLCGVRGWVETLGHVSRGTHGGSNEGKRRKNKAQLLFLHSVSQERHKWRHRLYRLLFLILPPPTDTLHHSLTHTTLLNIHRGQFTTCSGQLETGKHIAHDTYVTGNSLDFQLLHLNQQNNENNLKKNVSLFGLFGHLYTWNEL